MFSINKIYIILIITWLSILTLQAQTDLSWDILADVSFEEEKIEGTDSYWLVPTFGEMINLFDKQEVIISGYLIIVDLEDNFCVLSRHPFSSCFFCGGAGPESIIELQFDEPVKGVKMDQRVLVQGRLQLNKSDVDHFNFIVTNVRIIN